MLRGLNPEPTPARKLVFVGSPWIPAEWISAYGLTPHAAWRADGFLQGQPRLSEGICAFSETLVRFAETQVADAIVFASSCDQMRRGFDGLVNAGLSNVFLFNLPVVQNSSAAVRMFRSELERLGEFLEERGGRPPSAAELPQLLCGRNMTRGRLLEMATTCTGRRYAEALESYHGDGSLSIPHQVEPVNDAAIPLALVGGPLPRSQWWLLDALEDAGGRVVLNATETGERGLMPPFELASNAVDPLDAFASFSVGNCVDVFLRPNTRLYSWLDVRLKERGVRGIVLWHYVSCDLWRAEATRLRDTFGVPLLALDADERGMPSAREVGRVQAFMEAMRDTSLASAMTASSLRLVPAAAGSRSPSVRIRSEEELGAMSPPRRSSVADDTPRKISLGEWKVRYEQLKTEGLSEPWYGGPLQRHVEREGDLRLRHLRFDNSPASLRLWNFLLSENSRLQQAREQGSHIIGAMKDLGTVPVMAFSLPEVRAFYPDGAWWTPCVMECGDKLFQQADALGVDASFCPVRAMLPAFINGEHFPRPDLLVCSAGAVCDDFSAIAQRLDALGYPILWWEMPRRRQPRGPEALRELPGGGKAPLWQVACVRDELRRVATALGDIAGMALDDEALAEGIRKANQVRRLLRSLRDTVHLAPGAPLPALEMLVAEMLAIHFCSDLEEAVAVIGELLAEARARIRRNTFVVGEAAVRVFWVNPVADLRAMNLLEEYGGRVCGTEYMFTHALDLIPVEPPPLEALAMTALADPMVGSGIERAARVASECRACRAEALVVSRIPGASHCAREGAIIRETVRREVGIPSVEIEIPSLCDTMLPTLQSRLQALVETAQARRKS